MFLKLCIFVAFFGLGTMSEAYAARLLVLQNTASDNPVYSEVMNRLESWLIQKHLNLRYEKIEFLKAQASDPMDLLQKIQQFSEAGDFDLIIASKIFPLNRDAIRAQGQMSHLRNVYMTAKGSDVYVSDWMDIGAKYALGHDESENDPGLFFPVFYNRLGKSGNFEWAAQEAKQSQQRTMELIGGYLKKGECRFTSHQTAFEDLSIRLMTGTMPFTDFDANRVSNVGEFIDRTAPVAWESLTEAFDSNSHESLVDDTKKLDRNLGVPHSNIGALQDDSIWLPGDALKFFLEPLRDWVGDEIGKIVDHLEGARLDKHGPEMKVYVFFDQPVSVRINPKPKKMEPYQLNLPKEFRMSFGIRNETVLNFFNLDQPGYTAKGYVNIPLFKDDVNLRSIKIDLVSGKIVAEAGLWRNWVVIVAKGQFLAKKFDGVDIWKTILKNIKILSLPLFLFGFWL